MQEATTFATNYEMHVHRLHEIKETIAPGFAIVVREVAQTGSNPEHIMEDILKLSRLLDLSAPAPRKAANSFTDPRYNLVDYIKRNSNSRTIREINPDEILFDKNIPFTCISQIEDMFQDVSQKINRHYIKGSDVN